MPRHRLVVMESFDSNNRFYQWVEPDITALGWEVWSLPTAELVDFLGVSSYVSAFINVIKEIKPHVVFLHSPFPLLDRDALAEIRAIGTRIVCLTDPVADSSSDLASTQNIEAMHRTSDLWLVTHPLEKAVEAGAVVIPWTTTAKSIAVDDPNAPTFEVVLLGERSEQRQALASRLAKQVNLACFGKGWMTGEITRASRLGLIRRARCVIVMTNASQFSPEFMVEAAMLGIPFIAEYHEEIARHFVEADAVNTFHSDDECLDWVTSHSNDQTAPSSIGWKETWPRIVDKLSLATLTHSSGMSPTLVLLYTSLARFYKHLGKHRQAQVCLAHWIRAAPNAPEPHIQLARYAYLLANWDAVIQHTHDAEVLLLQTHETNEAGAAFTPPYSPFNPFLMHIEIRCLRIRAYIQLEDDEPILSEIEGLNAQERQAIYKQLQHELRISKLTHITHALVNEEG